MLFSFLAHLEFERRASGHTVAAYQYDLEQFSDFLKSAFGIGELSDAGHAEIRAWMVDLIEQGLAATTVNRKIATLKSFYKFLLRSGEIERDPTYKVRSLKKPKRLPAFVQEAAMDKVLDEFDYSDDFEGQRDRMVMEFLYGTGVRLSELIGLRWAQVDMVKGEVKVLGKGKKYRIIPISSGMNKNIIRYQKLFQETFPNVTESDYFIVRNSREPAYPMMIYRIVKYHLALFVQTTKRSPHVLRHTFATHLLNKGADLNAVKDLLGHASLAATQVYTHNSIEKLRAVFEQAHPKA
ncbi:Integrase, site-specific recombinase [Lunatimonas lonarensis]|uniref:Integrase, site-specific recombinase n=1 Tax=Lunatimonas lonarensis TaxID=1232681 RepID=R7ZNF8_9BACT|nr:tyrosine-type recombinase/integrase [Lunatimonas lonarensis]EON75651.1 Integrase, site-specific recombinase [Lunatimonas lonarensis]